MTINNVKIQKDFDRWNERKKKIEKGAKIESIAVLSQIRLLSSKRLLREIEIIKPELFKQLKKQLETVEGL